MSLSVSLKGMHVRYITMHILNLNITLFSDGNDISFDVFKKKVNRILANDVKKKAGNIFMRVKNPKTNKFRKGYY